LHIDKVLGNENPKHKNKKNKIKKNNVRGAWGSFPGPNGESRKEFKSGENIFNGKSNNCGKIRGKKVCRLSGDIKKID